jgi:hypothetical protein
MLFLLFGVDILVTLLGVADHVSYARVNIAINTILIAGLVFTFALTKKGHDFAFIVILIVSLFRVPISAVVIGGSTWVLFGVFLFVLAGLAVSGKLRTMKISLRHLGISRGPILHGKLALPMALAAAIIIGLYFSHFAQETSVSRLLHSILDGVLLGLLVSAPISVYRVRNVGS